MISGTLAPMHWMETTVEAIAGTGRNALVGGPFGSNLVSKDYRESGVPVIRGQNMGNGRWVSGDFAFVSKEKAAQLSANIARPNDIVFTQRGTLGQVAVVPAEPYDTYVVSQSQMKLTVDPSKADPKFIYYLFSSPTMQQYMVVNAIQTGVPHTNLGILRNTPIRIPAQVDDQRAIAHILGTLDDKIELNRQMNQTLDEIARTLFTSWFVNFDPVRAKAEGLQPEGMDAETAALFPDRFVDSELGPIPAGWQVRAVGDLADINRSAIRSRDEWDSIRYIDISSTSNGDISETPIFLRGQEPSRARRRLRHGDTALSTVRPNRRSYFLALNPPDDLIASTGFAVASPSKAPWSFLHSALTLDTVFEELGRVADGGAYPAIRPDVIGRLPVIVPNDERILAAYHSSAAPMYSLAASNREESRTLAELRDLLLPHLLSGEVNLTAQSEELVP